MSYAPASKHSYPWTTQLRDKRVTLRLMQPEEATTLLAFARSLPEEDLLFLSIDITKPEAVESWAHNIRAGRIVTVMAEFEGKMIGHGTLSHNDLLWTRHMGELQLLISRDYRGIGLGQLLAKEVYSLARQRGLQKIVARMASDQKSAIRVFERMGFRAEALLADYVIDRKGHTHDLIVMSTDLTGLTL